MRTGMLEQGYGQMRDVYGLLSPDHRSIKPASVKEFVAPRLNVSALAKTLEVPRTSLYEKTSPLSDEWIKKRIIPLVLSADIAFELFKDREKARLWMITENAYFFGQSPFDLCLKGEGEKVIKFLMQRAGKISGQPY
jgi:hypothetical protein